ncbi:hypothetical protein QBD01_000746 [Ochrobactrum sp. 19YEA23]|uniref:hypothetical protein n=1 Tax=Ochrobactrum sp. 19YEA23 TaxID=3039854 RepID=UPI0024786768|nr:hypothetical protein [Ochrobactrum sp. 19YEA23]
MLDELDTGLGLVIEMMARSKQDFRKVATGFRIKILPDHTSAPQGQAQAAGFMSHRPETERTCRF